MSNYVYSFDLDDKSVSPENVDIIIQVVEKGINRALDIIREEDNDVIFQMLSDLESGNISFTIDNCVDIMGYGIVLEFISNGILEND